MLKILYLISVLMNLQEFLGIHHLLFLMMLLFSVLYQVTITDDTDNIVIEYVTIEHEHEVSIDILNLCSIYTVSVIAFDDTYTSDSSIAQQEYTGGNYIVL